MAISPKPIYTKANHGNFGNFANASGKFKFKCDYEAQIWPWSHFLLPAEIVIARK